MQPLLLLVAFLLTPRAKAGEIIGGHEAKPHSRPYMAYLQYWNQDIQSRCGGFLVREDFVLTAAHCHGSSMNVTLGAHNIKQQERTQQVIGVRRAICHPDYNPKNFSNDIMLLKLERKAKQTSAVKPLRLPRAKVRVKPGQVCSVAGWGRDSTGSYADTLQEVKLTVQEDRECEAYLRNYYNRANQLCVGDPKTKKATFKARLDSPVPSSSEHEADANKVHKQNSPFPSGEIIGGHEAKPHSRPYMAYLQYWNQDVRHRCGGFLVREDFVLTAAHCHGSSIKVTLGAHNIKQQERTQQVIGVRRAICHPDYNPKNYSNDIMLLKLERKAKQTSAVKPLSLPKAKARVKPGQVCSVAGWGRDSTGTCTDTLQEVKLTVQEDRECEAYLPEYYNHTNQLCVGDPNTKKASFKPWLHEHSGQAGIFLSEKIIGGQEAKPHSRPYMAFLRFKTSGKSGKCGGFLVREDFVLTAAHCWGRQMKVTLGAHNIKEKERTQQIILSRRAIRHPGYNSETCANDLMLLQLKRKAKMTAAVSTIGLPSSSDTVNPGMLCSVAGWGLLRVNGSTANKLQEVELEVQRDEKCKSRYRVYNTSTQMCVGNPRMRSNAMEPFLSEEIIGSHEAKPHSRPYMALVQPLDEKSWKKCGGIVTQKDFVLTAAHCRGRILEIRTTGAHQISHLTSRTRLNQRHPGGHNIKQQERTQQVIRVKRAIRHPDYNPENFSNDIIPQDLIRQKYEASEKSPVLKATTREKTLVRRPDGSRSCSDLGSFPAEMVLFLVLLLLALLLSPTGEAAKIIGGHEAKPHSSPYMAYLQIQTEDKIFICGGFLVHEDFVLMAAHCQGSLCSSINVTLGAHNIMDREKTQQVIPVRRAIPHPRYNDKTLANDIMLLQLNHHHPGGHNIKQQERTQQAFGWECKCGDSVVLTYPTAENMGTRGMLTPACGEHSSGRSINVTLGAHNIMERERTQQVIPVRRAIPHPEYNDETGANDIMLLQVGHVAALTPDTSFLGFCIPHDLIPDPAEEIIGGHEAKPHSRPYMALVQHLGENGWKRCGGVLIQKDFVLTAAHCRGSSINVTLGAHNIKQQERTQQLERKAKQTSAVKPLSLPKAKARVKPGQVCSLAGWGQVAPGTPATTLQEAEVTVQEDQVCESLYPRHYSRATQICVGDPKKVKTGFKIQTPAGLTICGGFLVREDFVMTAARCLGSQINVILGIHSVTASEWTQQRIPVLRPIPHPRYNQRNNRNDIMLLQGDSGGPLVCSNVAQGIVSYGDRVGTPPAVFTRISSFLPWIRRTMRRFQERTPE
ncbi:hypothetical protein MG293_014570 [Ovis ammon polii]|uniref:Peptidase S1 domain-containing protein n=1 Tax=Ovis ammon polii TaxID=230172 RepID=A0AAD4Y566_OVIAM|nr:hypothetical protein MG293_014570 [Ovis ammon polii]